MLYTYLIILTLFILFITYQIYFYSGIYKKNDILINKIENFQSTLENIDTKYVLDDKSIELLLDDYNKLKNNL